MPELTEVERFRKYIAATSLHKSIEKVEVNDRAILRECSPGMLNSRLSGRSFSSAERLGKHLFLPAGGAVLALHFGMTGRPLYRKSNNPGEKDRRLSINFRNGYSLLYLSRRRLGKIRLADDIESFGSELGLGPDALYISLETFKKIFAGRRGMIKTALMDQKLLAGLGNILSDEILFSAGINPKKQVKDLNSKTLGILHREMLRVLNRGISGKPGEGADSSLSSLRADGENCPICGGVIRLIKIQGRSAYYCPRHQNNS